MRTNIFDRLSFLSLFLTITLLPFFFLPFTNIPIEISKGLLLVVGLALCLIFWAVARFFDGKISLPRSSALLTALGVVLSVFLSALFSSAKGVSFFGTIFDIGTFWFIFAGFLLLLMSSIILRNTKSAKVILSGAIFSSSIVLIFQSARLFLPDLLSLGVLGDKTGNIIGSWNALGLFAGFSALMSLLIVEFSPMDRMKKILLQALVLLSLLIVAIVNFPFVWILIGIASLIIFVYKLSLNSKEGEEAEGIQSEEKKKYFPAFSFAIILVALLFFMSGQFIGGFLPTKLGISNTEVSPSFGATMQVTKSVLKADPVFGVGPNKFAAAWAKYKPISINDTPFWDISFNTGSGLLPTFAATIGALGILAWLVFFAFFLTGGVKSIFGSIRSGANWETMAFFVLSLYLFISSFLYATGVVLFLLALAFAGISIGLSAKNRTKGQAEMGEISISFLNDHRKSFFSILFLVLLIIMGAGISFKYVERFASVAYFRSSLVAATVEGAEASINKAINLYPNDLYLRTYAQIYLVKLNSIARGDKPGETPTEADKVALQAALTQAVSGAQLAATYDSTNYLNFQALGGVYQAVALLGVKDANAQAIVAYTSAADLNPNNPGIRLSLAVAAFADNKVKEAKKYANIAIGLKPDYIDALIMLSQIAKKEGDNAAARAYAEQALAVSPTNQDLIKYVESLQGSSSSSTTDKDNSTKKP